ncbi:MAG: hypothetical protein H6625_09910 [Bdellovibrionaceae bacterium]|nr:hypothetical protein [Pseudobdellovibrionaceae bacterium]
MRKLIFGSFLSLTLLSHNTFAEVIYSLLPPGMTNQYGESCGKNYGILKHGQLYDDLTTTSDNYGGCFYNVRKAIKTIELLSEVKIGNLQNIKDHECKSVKTYLGEAVSSWMNLSEKIGNICAVVYGNSRQLNGNQVQLENFKASLLDETYRSAGFAKSQKKLRVSCHYEGCL